MNPPDRLSLGDPQALIGEWTLERQLHDEIAGVSGTASGRLMLTADGDRIAWREQGTLLWNGATLPFTRNYWFRRVGDGWWLDFLDGRPFHAWCPGEWVHHPCAEDDYRGLVSIDGPGSWQTRWELRGPEKAQLLTTQFRLVHSPGG